MGNFGTVFLDNGYYNKAIAASPVDALPGYIMGGYESHSSLTFHSDITLQSLVVCDPLAVCHNHGPGMSRP